MRDLLVAAARPTRASDSVIALALIGSGTLLLRIRNWRQRHALFARHLLDSRLYVVMVYVAGPVLLIVLGLVFLAGAVVGT
jgi:hypothetical protein